MFKVSLQDIKDSQSLLSNANKFSTVLDNPIAECLWHKITLNNGETKYYCDSYFDGHNIVKFKGNKFSVLQEKYQDQYNCFTCIIEGKKFLFISGVELEEKLSMKPFEKDLSSSGIDHSSREKTAKRARAHDWLPSNIGGEHNTSATGASLLLQQENTTLKKEKRGLESAVRDLQNCNAVLQTSNATLQLRLDYLESLLLQQPVPMQNFPDFMAVHPGHYPMQALPTLFAPSHPMFSQGQLTIAESLKTVDVTRPDGVPQKPGNNGTK